ncbi:ATP-binding cassette domain-containing protein [Spongiimicrobium salis]|uniref:ATP-binding cassette domain-containing protein n=1 Tax=Spongiimicrobium salis TaxID=1667022 RepID=UPI00374CD460
MLEIDNVELEYGRKKVLYGIYIKAEAGEVTGILGRNGSGKTSLLRILFGTLHPKYKNVRLNGVHQKTDLFKTNSIGYLPQHQLLPPSISVMKTFHLFHQNWEGFVQEFQLFDKYKKAKIKHLSSGERRVMETYLILMTKKDIILLDEPFSFIAPLYIDKIKALIRRQQKEKIIMITDHLYEEILDISDTVYYLKDGRSKIIDSKEVLINEGYINNSLD